MTLTPSVGQRGLAPSVRSKASIDCEQRDAL
jgi:hypothetical protein